MKVFVYGTLMSAYPAHGYIRGEKLIELNATLPGYRMYRAGYYPFIVPEGEFSVHGELWDVDDDLIPSIDRYEGHPHFYKRVAVTVYDHDGVTHEAQTYVFNEDHPRHRNDNFEPIDSGVWRP